MPTFDPSPRTNRTRGVWRQRRRVDRQPVTKGTIVAELLHLCGVAGAPRYRDVYLVALVGDVDVDVVDVVAGPDPGVHE
jgi:hypothetical protein